MVLALVGVSAARQTKDSASSLPQALQDLEQILQPSPTKSDSAEALAGEHSRHNTQGSRRTSPSGHAPSFPKRLHTEELCILACFITDRALATLCMLCLSSLCLAPDP